MSFMRNFEIVMNAAVSPFFVLRFLNIAGNATRKISQELDEAIEQKLGKNSSPTKIVKAVASPLKIVGSTMRMIGALNPDDIVAEYKIVLGKSDTKPERGAILVRKLKDDKGFDRLTYSFITANGELKLNVIMHDLPVPPGELTEDHLAKLRKKILKRAFANTHGTPATSEFIGAVQSVVGATTTLWEGTAGLVGEGLAYGSKQVVNAGDSMVSSGVPVYNVVGSAVTILGKLLTSSGQIIANPTIKSLVTESKAVLTTAVSGTASLADTTISTLGGGKFGFGDVRPFGELTEDLGNTLMSLGTELETINTHLNAETKNHPELLHVIYPIGDIVGQLAKLAKDPANVAEIGVGITSDPIKQAGKNLKDQAYLLLSHTKNLFEEQKDEKHHHLEFINHMHMIGEVVEQNAENLVYATAQISLACKGVLYIPSPADLFTFTHTTSAFIVAGEIIIDTTETAVDLVQDAHCYLAKRDLQTFTEATAEFKKREEALIPRIQALREVNKHIAETEEKVRLSTASLGMFRSVQMQESFAASIEQRRKQILEEKEIDLTGLIKELREMIDTYRIAYDKVSERLEDHADILQQIKAIKAMLSVVIYLGNRDVYSTISTVSGESKEIEERTSQEVTIMNDAFSALLKPLRHIQREIEEHERLFANAKAVKAHPDISLVQRDAYYQRTVSAEPISSVTELLEQDMLPNKVYRRMG